MRLLTSESLIENVFRNKNFSKCEQLLIEIPIKVDSFRLPTPKACLYFLRAPLPH